MKKTWIATLGLSLLLLGCENKWQEDISYIPPETVQLYQDTIDTNLETLKNDPKNSTALFDVAYNYDHLGDLKNAEKYYLKVLELDPNHIVALNNLMNVYEKVGEYDKAATEAKLLFNLSPHSLEVMRDSFRIFMEAEDPDSARLVLEYYSTANKDTITEEELKEIGDLYQQILDYNTAHGIQ